MGGLMRLMILALSLLAFASMQTVSNYSKKESTLASCDKCGKKKKPKLLA